MQQFFFFFVFFDSLKIRKKKKRKKWWHSECQNFATLIFNNGMAKKKIPIWKALVLISFFFFCFQLFFQVFFSPDDFSKTKDFIFFLTMQKALNVFGFDKGLTGFCCFKKKLIIIAINKLLFLCILFADYLQ